MGLVYGTLKNSNGNSATQANTIEFHSTSDAHATDPWVYQVTTNAAGSYSVSVPVDSYYLSVNQAVWTDQFNPTKGPLSVLVSPALKNLSSPNTKKPDFVGSAPKEHAWFYHPDDLKAFHADPANDLDGMIVDLINKRGDEFYVVYEKAQVNGALSDPASGFGLILLDAKATPKHPWPGKLDPRNV